jgi:hypothetical protein
MTWDRLGAATGIVFVALLSAGAIIGGQPGDQDVVEFFVANRRPLLTQAYLYGLSMVFLIWFLGSVRSHLHQSEGGTGRLSAVSFAGGIIFVTVLFVSGIVNTALATGIAIRSDPDTTRALYQVAVLANDLNWFPMGVFTGAATLVAFRHNALPRWLAWFGAAVALSSLIGALAIVVDTGPFSSAGVFSDVVGLLLFLLWLVLLSVVLIQKAGRTYESSAMDIGS